MKYELDTIRHSTAHIMASAIKKLYPKTKLGIGPTIMDGFYYDFDSSHRFSESDFEKIESEMYKIKSQSIPFERIEKEINQAIKYADEIDEPYKKILIKKLKSQGEKKVSFYKTGEFIDLCKGPHVANSSKIKEFKLLSVAGAYWQGSEKNKMLQRIYGTSWESKGLLAMYLEKKKQMIERDHRKIGKELGLFMISSEVGRGLPIWLPKGAKIRREIENFVVDMERKSGYEHVYSPHIGRLDLYKTSGHWQHYKDLMYPPIEIEGEKYLLRAMNCPHHIVIYKNTPTSYKKLPVRIAEEGTVYRYEKSGELAGLSRVRAFTINDAHIFCTREQISAEVQDILKLAKKLYKAVGFTQYKLELSLRDPKDKEKYVAGDSLWDDVEKSLKLALDKTGEKYEVKIGEAAFYGPKIDIQAQDSLGRELTISTIQLDAYLPKRFKLNYTDHKGQKQTPFLIHRALVGSFERFFAFLIEHHNGQFPLWLAPTQAIILPIAQRHNEYSTKIVSEMKASSVRAELNDTNETLQAKVRDAQLKKIPYIIVIGDREKVKKEISVRTLNDRALKNMDVKTFIDTVSEEVIQEKNG